VKKIKKAKKGLAFGGFFGYSEKTLRQKPNKARNCPL